MKKTTLKYRFDRIKPNSRKKFKVDNIKSCQRSAQMYAKRHGLDFTTLNVPGEGLYVYRGDE